MKRIAVGVFQTSVKPVFCLMFAALLAGCSALPEPPPRAIVYDFGAGSVQAAAQSAQDAQLAPLILVLGWRRRRRQGPEGGARSTPLVPLFVAGFLAMTLVRTWLPLPPDVFSLAKTAQVLLLSAAMFALGTGVHVSLLRKVGGRPVLLGALSTALVTIIGTGGALLLG